MWPLRHEHDASQLLKQDIKDCLHEGMSPNEFRQTRAQYMEIGLEIFRMHIYQKQRKQREMPMKITKCNKLAKAKHKEALKRN